VQADVKQWEANNPQLLEYLEEAVGAGNMFLEAHGIAALGAENAVQVAASAVLAALKQMAALDATVNSHATTEFVERLPTPPAPAAPSPAPLVEKEESEVAAEPEVAEEPIASPATDNAVTASLQQLAAKPEGSE
jgi:hypothetical protein